MAGLVDLGGAVDGHGGTLITSVPMVTTTVDTPAGMDFSHHNALADMGAGSLQSGASTTSFTLVDSKDNVSFVVDGYGFTRLQLSILPMRHGRAAKAVHVGARVAMAGRRQCSNLEVLSELGPQHAGYDLCHGMPGEGDL